MAVALTLTTQNYVLNAERNLPPNEQTVFLIRPLGARESAEVQDIIILDGENVLNINQMLLERVARGLVGWKNFADSDGKPVEFSEKIEENLNRVTPYISELSTAIKAISELSGDQEKN